MLQGVVNAKTGAVISPEESSILGESPHSSAPSQQGNPADLVARRTGNADMLQKWA
jgi:hypothetical protein